MIDIAPSVHPSAGLRTEFGQGITWDNLPDWKEPAKPKCSRKIQPPQVGNTLAESEIIKRALSAKNGQKFNSIGKARPATNKSASEADQALMQLACLLVFQGRGKDRCTFPSVWIDAPQVDERHYSDGRAYGQACIVQKRSSLARKAIGSRRPGRIPPTEDGIALAYAGRDNDSPSLLPYNGRMVSVVWYAMGHGKNTSGF